MRMATLVLGLLTACGGGAPATDLAPVPTLEFESMEPRVAQVLRGLHANVTSGEASARAWAELGFALDAHALLVEGEVCLGNAVALDPEGFEHAYMYAFLGDLNGRDPAEVERRFRAAIALRDDYAPAHLRMGDAMNRAGRGDVARAAYERALEIDPSYGKAHSGLGALLSIEGDPSAAIEHLERARAEAPDDRPTIAALAQAYTLTGRMEEAQAASARVQELAGAQLSYKDPIRSRILASAVSSWSAFQRAQRSIQAGDLAAALPDLEIVAEAQPNEAGSFARLAFVTLRLGRLDESVMHLTTALALDPAHPESNALMGQIEVERGEFEEALARFERAYQGEPLDVPSHFAWGVALARQVRYDESAAQFQLVIEQDPGNVDGHYRRALALELGGRVPEAIASYRKAVALAPTHPLAQRLPPLLER